MIDPVQALGNLPSAISHHHHMPSVSPLPTVIPEPYPDYQVAGNTGKRTLWVVFVIMTIATVVFSGMSWSVPVSKRLYHFITTLIVAIAAMSYFAMATGDGVTLHEITLTHSHQHVPDTYETVLRQVYWARYVDWSLTTPLLLLDLCLLAGLSGGHTLMAISADLIMVLTGLFAAFGTEGTPQKWGWYAIACIAYLVIVWHLALHGRANAMAKGNKIGALFGSLALFTIVLWTAYPIVWGVADGSRIASVNAEIIAYAVLDVLAKPVFGLWLLVAHANLPESNLSLGGWWSHGVSTEGAIRVGEDEDGA